MRKWLAITLVLCMLLPLTGCDGLFEKEEKVTLYVVTEQKNYTKESLSSVSTFEYDDHGRPTVVQFERSDETTYRSELIYDEHGNCTRETYSFRLSGGNEWSTYVYDYSLTYTDGRITHCDRFGNEELIGGMDLQYDSNGYLVLVDYDDTYVQHSYICWQSFAYDSAGRLIREMICRRLPGGLGETDNYVYSYTQVEYSYDDNGNLSTCSVTGADSTGLVEPDQTDSLDFQHAGERFAFATDRDGYLMWVGSEPNPDYPNGQFSVMENLEKESFVFDEHGNLVKSVGSEFSYQAMELSESDAQMAKRLMHGIASGLNAYSYFACMDPLYIHTGALRLYTAYTYFPFYYLIPYPMW